MKYLKKLGKGLIFSFGSIVVLTFLITVFNYFDILSGKVMGVLKIIIPLFSLALGGFVMGKCSSKNGYIEGLKLGLIIILLIAFGNLIFLESVTYKDGIYYLLLLISSIFGSMFGINMKKESTDSRTF